MTKTTLGLAITSLENLSSSGVFLYPFMTRVITSHEGQVRLKLDSHDGRAAGFVTISSWSDEEEAGGSARSTPSHGQASTQMSSTISQQRSQSLPIIQRW